MASLDHAEEEEDDIIRIDGRSIITVASSSCLTFNPPPPPLFNLKSINLIAQVFLCQMTIKFLL